MNVSRPVLNIGGVPLGEPIVQPFEMRKHIEARHFDNVMKKGQTWLGMLNVIDSFKEVSMPFIKTTELAKNVIYVDGPGSKLVYGLSFTKGSAMIMENLCDGSATIGKGNAPFPILMSENCFSYGDIITSDLRNGKSLRVQTLEKHGEEARIRPMLNGYRFLVALDSPDDEAFYSQEFLVPGTPYFKSFQNNGGEFEDIRSTYSGMDKQGPNGSRQAVQLYEYTVGSSEQAISTWLTADSTYRNMTVENSSHPALANMKQASMDVSNYLMRNKDGSSQSSFWISNYTKSMITELAMMKNNQCTWSKGHSFTNARGEKISIGLGLYEQIKQRGHYNSYSDFDQLFDLLMNAGDRFFGGTYNVPIKDRVMRVNMGRLAYTEISKRMAQYFKTANPFPVLADHPALIKSNMITYSEDIGVIYKPLEFRGLELPGQGLLVVNHDPSLDMIDFDLESTSFVGDKPISSGMAYVEDITDGNFSNAVPQAMRTKTQRNVSMIMKAGYSDLTQYRIGYDCQDEFVRLLAPGLSNKSVNMDKKGIEVRMSTNGEAFISDPSRTWLIEYNPFNKF